MSLHRLIPLIAAAFVAAAPALNAQAVDESTLIAQAADRLAASGKSLLISADELQALLKDPARAPLLVSVCAPDDYARAHIPGSINIPRGAVFKPANLSKLPPKDRPIVTYCYTGTGAIGTATVLNLMGYDARQLAWGTMGWSRNDAVLGPATRFPESQQNYPVVTGPQGTAVTYARPVIATGKASLDQILIERGDAVESADRTVSMTAEAVQALLIDADKSNDPFIVDLRSPADFVKGHIAGAVNIPAATIYQSGSLAKLPLGRRIVTVDYNGQTTVGVSYVLSILGYNARGLQYGMMGWSRDDALMGGFKRFPADIQRDLPFAGSASRAK
jgi:rhodanese-related sulfurtransferase